MAISAQSENRSTKEIELNSELDGEGTVSHGQKFVSSKDIMWIGLKISDRDNFTFSNLSNFSLWVVSSFIPTGIVVSWNEFWVCHHLEILITLGIIEIKKRSA